MFKVIKKSGFRVNAYRLGDGGEVLDALRLLGRIKINADGTFEIFSREAVNGKGEIAKEGDYIKIDSEGFPYPNDAEFFEKNHKLIEKNLYEQIQKPLYAWSSQEPMCEEIEFLIAKKGLKLNKDNPDKYFNAVMWSTELSAACDAVIIFYSISRDICGHITDADFNFVCRTEFDKNYQVI